MGKITSNIGSIQELGDISNNPVKRLKMGKKRDSLDTLALLSTGSDEKNDGGRGKIIKKQIAKAITIAQLYQLIDLNSPLKKSYWNTWHCNNVIIQEGQKLTSKYCNGRWCNVCNRVRMAKMINSYSLPLLSLNDIHFVTLTAPNVGTRYLKTEVDKFFSTWRRIYKNIKTRYKHIQLKGMRKFEITFNPHTGFNPHFHFIVSGSAPAKLLVDLWLKQFPNANRRGQDIRKVRHDKKSLLEVFKYISKPITKGYYSAKAYDEIMIAAKRHRVTDPLGCIRGRKEHKDELSLEELQSQTIEFKGHRVEVWKYVHELYDYLSPEGELLLGTKLDRKTLNAIKVIEQSKNYDEAKRQTETKLMYQNRCRDKDKDKLF